MISSGEDSICRIRVLVIGFEREIRESEIRFFRGAVSDIAGPEHVLFHNHLRDGYRYRYPLIQYKTWSHRPMIVCINEGVDEVHHFFEHKRGNLILGNREYDLQVARISLNRFTMQTWDKTFRYTLYNWLPLNQNNYKTFKEITGEQEKRVFLERVLTGNILSMAKGIGWWVQKEKLKVSIPELHDPYVLKVKGVLREAYTLEFHTNAFLPDFIGLGKNASLGFGKVKSNRRKKNDEVEDK